MGEPSGLRIPPWLLRIRTWAPSISFGLQPMPAFWLNPKRSPDGHFLSISGDKGSFPDGPSAWVRILKIPSSSTCRNDFPAIVIGPGPEKRAPALRPPRLFSVFPLGSEEFRIHFLVPLVEFFAHLGDLPGMDF